MGEMVINCMRAEIPVVTIRPSVIESTWRLPRLDGRKQVNAKPKSEVADVTYICDASSSAYQIMSYFQDLAVRTNF